MTCTFASTRSGATSGGEKQNPGHHFEGGRELPADRSGRASVTYVLIIICNPCLDTVPGGNLPNISLDRTGDAGRFGRILLYAQGGSGGEAGWPRPISSKALGIACKE